MTASVVDRARRVNSHQISVTVHDRQPTSGTRILAGSPDAVLQIVPLLVGFTPESSIVVLGTEPPEGTVSITLRYDLPDPPDPDLSADVAEHTLAVLRSQGLDAAIAVGYGPDTLVKPLAAAFRDALANDQPGESGLIDFLRVEGDRYWSYTCTDENCCPPGGVRFDPAEDPDAPAGGVPVLANRAAVAASIAPLTGAAAQAMRQATSRARRHLIQIGIKAAESGGPRAHRRAIIAAELLVVAEMITAYRGGGRYASKAQVARLTVALKDMRVRDDAWARMDPGYTEAHLRMWFDVVRLARPGHVGAPASLLAFVAWQSGDGVLANVALDRALADDPGYSMADVLRKVIGAGAPPSMARLPMTPEEVAACYEDPNDDDEEAEEESEDEDDDEDLRRRARCGRSPRPIEPGPSRPMTAQDWPSAAHSAEHL